MSDQEPGFLIRPVAAIQAERRVAGYKSKEAHVLERLGFDPYALPSKDVGLIRNHPVNLTRHWTLTLADGRAVRMDHLCQYNVYDRLIFGMPNVFVEEEFVYAIKRAEELFPSFKLPPVVLPPELVTGQVDTRWCGQRCREGWIMLPPVCSIATFLADAVSNDELYSSALVIWFQDEFGLPDARAASQLPLLDWPSVSCDWTP